MTSSTDSFDFILNGERVTVRGVAGNTTLLQFLRSTGRTGTKEGCAEGDCGACTVALVDRNARGETTYRAINACIALVPMFAGREIVTVEGLASEENGTLHPVQEAMVKQYGSQCGYCTPGFIVSMFEGYYRDDLKTQADIGDQLHGNLCRCTGYRPIRDAMCDAIRSKKIAESASSKTPDVFQLRLSKEAGEIGPVEYEGDGERFLRPTTLADLLSLRTKHPDAELVAGATEIGVYLNKRAQRFPFLISTEGVTELRAIREDADGAFHIGGAATLTDIDESLGETFPEIRKMLSAFASRQIRSRATLAGNLVTASPIGDMAPVLLSLDARLVLASERGEREIPLDSFFLGYRKTALAKDEILKEIVVPRAPLSVKRVTRSYKVSKRRELDISIVAASLSVDLDGETIVAARFGFGGVAATPSRAKKAEAAAIGKPWTDETLADVRRAIEGDFTPIEDVRSGVDFRRGLISSLVRKYWSGEESLSQDLPFAFEEGTRWSETDASRALAHESGARHVTGEAIYVDDAACGKRALEMWPVISTHAHAKLKSVDITKALKMPGIVRVMTAKDVPGENNVGVIRKDEPLFPTDEVTYHSEVIAMVVGETLEQCRRAAMAVVVEYEPLPAIIGIRAAIQAQSFHTTPHVIARGDVDRAIASAPMRLEGDIEIGGQEHFYLESQAAFAEPGEDGEIFVSSSTQHPTEAQAMVAHVLHVPRNKITVESPRMGGGFGGKETQGNAGACYVALAASLTKRTVRAQLDRDLDMQITGKRHPFLGEFEIGFDAEGHVLGAKISLTSDGGHALDLSESILDRGLFHLDNSYYLPNVRFTGRVAKTNVTSHTAFRGFGGPQGMVVIEEVLDRIARRTGLAPEVVRARNLYRGKGATNTTHYGQELADERIPAIFTALQESAKLEERRAEIAKWNEKSPRIKRGIAITPVKFGISFTASFLNQAGALVLVYRDGTVQVNHGGTEMGQGLYTKVLGIAMRELGLPRESIRVMRTRTDKVPNTSATAASAGSDLNGQAVKDACETLRVRLSPIAAVALAEKTSRAILEDEVRFEDGYAFSAKNKADRVSFAEVVEKAYLQQIPLSVTGFYRTPGIGYDKAKGRGKPFYYFAYGAAVSEVEVCGYSGMKRVLRVDILHDVGESLNPGVDRGQIEGGFVQGMGWLTGEELKWDAKGRLLSHSASTYQIPAIGDAPADFRVELLKHAAQDGVIHGSKAVGEPPLMLAISVREAIRDAIAAFGDASEHGRRDVKLACPATHEAIFAAIRDRESPGTRERAAAE